MPLFSSKGVPLRRSQMILRNSATLKVHHTEHSLGIGMPLFSGKGVPLHCSLIILWNTFPFGVHPTQKGLSM